MADRSTWVAGHGRPATHDVVVVIGGGAAGLSAALVLGRARRRVAVVDAGQPRNAPAAHMQGFLSRDGMPPRELLTVGRAEVLSYGVEIIDDQAVEIEAGFSVRLRRADVLTARRILIATGVDDELPDIPGARERWGRDFLHCPYCHGWEVRAQPISVLATQNGSVEHAQLVRQWSDDVVFFSHTQTLSATERRQLDARGIRIIDGIVTRLLIEDDRLTRVELDDGRAIARTAVFIRPANLPHADELLDQLDVEADEAGFVAVDATGRTSTPGVWTAGNVVDPRAQVIAAAGSGNAATIAINADLVEEDIRNALQTTTVPERTAAKSNETERTNP
jgi:thioredoxin reductase